MNIQNMDEYTKYRRIYRIQMNTQNKEEHKNIKTIQNIEEYTKYLGIYRIQKNRQNIKEYTEYG